MRLGSESGLLVRSFAFGRNCEELIRGRNAGAWVRYLIGEDTETRQPVYRLCQVTGACLPVSPAELNLTRYRPASKEVPTRAYQFENVNTDIQLELAHSKSVRFFTMEGVSNSPFNSVRCLLLLETRRMLSKDRKSVV